MNKDDCIFCKIVKGDIPSKKLYEDEDFLVILDLQPATKGHALILPKEHAENLYVLSQETASKALILAKKMAVKMVEKLHCDGLNLVQNNGEIAGQTISHFHIHVIPRKEGDKVTLKHEGVKLSSEEMDHVGEAVKKALN